MRGTVGDRTWTVDADGDVQWRLTYQPSQVVGDDLALAAEVMGCYARLTDPDVSDKDAGDMLRDARMVTKAALDQVEADYRARVELIFAVEVDGEILGPFSHSEALDRAAATAGRMIRLRK